MKYYKSENNDVFAFEEDGSQDAFIRDDLTPITDEELAVIREAQAAAVAPTPEQVAATVNARRDELLALAGLRISPLQDAVDLDEATSAEVASLKLWKQYRIAVSRVTAQAGYPMHVDWPAQPTQ